MQEPRQETRRGKPVEDGKRGRTGEGGETRAQGRRNSTPRRRGRPARPSPGRSRSRSRRGQGDRERPKTPERVMGRKPATPERAQGEDRTRRPGGWPGSREQVVTSAGGRSSRSTARPPRDHPPPARPGQPRSPKPVQTASSPMGGWGMGRVDRKGRSGGSRKRENPRRATPGFPAAERAEETGARRPRTVDHDPSQRPTTRG